MHLQPAVWPTHKISHPCRQYSVRSMFVEPCIVDSSTLCSGKEVALRWSMQTLKCCKNQRKSCLLGVWRNFEGVPPLPPRYHNTRTFWLMSSAEYTRLTAEPVPVLTAVVPTPDIKNSDWKRDIVMNESFDMGLPENNNHPLALQIHAGSLLFRATYRTS